MAVPAVVTHMALKNVDRLLLTSGFQLKNYCPNYVFVYLKSITVVQLFQIILERCKASHSRFAGPQYATYRNDQLHTVLYCATSLSRLRLRVVRLHHWWPWAPQDQNAVRTLKYINKPIRGRRRSHWSIASLAITDFSMILGVYIY